jgi:hypothetical protein
MLCRCCQDDRDQELDPDRRVLGKWLWWGIRNTHYERVAWSVFHRARHLDYKGLSEKVHRCGRAVDVERDVG